MTYSPGNSNYRSLSAVPDTTFTPASGTGTGWTATYYSGPAASGTPLGSEVVTSLNVTSTPSIVTSAGVSTWSVRYTATMTPSATGTDEFGLSAGGPASLSIGGKQIVSYGPGTGSTFTGLADVTAGQGVPFELEVTSISASTGGGFFGPPPPVTLTWAPQENLLWEAAAKAAASASVAVVFASNYSSEGSDLQTLELPGDQDQLIQAVARANPRTVVVLNTSGPAYTPWLNGVAGGATVLNPSPQFPGNGTSVTYTEGIDVGYRYYDTHHQNPLFPFGYGLSYTTFVYSGLRLHPGPRDSETATVTITNTGRTAGAEVAQLYLTDPASAGEQPYQLKGFQKITLAPGHSQQVTFEISRQDMSYYNSATNGWMLAPGSYRVSIGSNERDLAVSDSYYTTGTGGNH